MPFDALRQILALPSISLPKGSFGTGSNEYKFGFNSAVGTTEATIWAQGGRYAFPSSASTMTVSSGSANDTSAGTGARTVEIFGLDGNYAEASETVTLNGQTEITTTNSYLRMHRAVVRSAGSNATNEGVIYVGTGAVTAGVPANIFTTIAIGEGQTLQAFFTIPAAKTAYLSNFIVSSFGNANAFITVRLRVRPFGEVFQTKDKFVVTRAAPMFPRNYSSIIAARSDIEVTAIADTGTLDASAAFELVLEDD